MAEIILNELSLCILDEKMLITLRHRMNLRYVRYDKDVIANAPTLLNRLQPLLLLRFEKYRKAMFCL